MPAFLGCWVRDQLGKLSILYLTFLRVVELLLWGGCEVGVVKGSIRGEKSDKFGVLLIAL